MNIENSLAARFPELAAEWHPTKNGDLTPDKVAPGSGKKVWWKCKKYGHEWQARILNRSHGNNCPYCTGAKVLTEFNDLATIDPELAEEWHPTKNGDLTPKTVASRSGKKAWWKCKKCGHEWQARIASRFYGCGCPVCWGNKPLPGVNDLATTNKKLAEEWHPTKNGDLTPRDVTAGSDKDVWWKCLHGHEWSAKISNRSHGNNCPTCTKERHTSFPEQAILYYFQKVTPAESRNQEFGKEIDVYLPELGVGIEYNGYWHQNKEQADAEKVSYLAMRNIRIITVKESTKNRIVGDSIEYIYSSSQKDSLNWAISEVFNMLELPKPSVDTDADALEIYNQYIILEKEKSPARKHPNIAAEWHPTKNGYLTSDMVSVGSNKKVWWKCKKCGYEWQAKVCNRSAGQGCPVCANQKVLPGFNDLATANKKLAEEWHPTKNGDLTPQIVFPKSRKKVWWKCKKCGYEWQAIIANRSNGRGCPECYRRNRISRARSLLTTHAELAAEWHPTRNRELTPEKVTIDYPKKVWWKGECGHSWREIPRIRATEGCPVCARNKAKRRSAEPAGA